MSEPMTAFKNIQRFLDDGRGQITIGEIPPIQRAALAAEGKKPRVALVCREGETAAALLERLDASYAKFWGSWMSIGGAICLPYLVPFAGLPYIAPAALWAVLICPVAFPVGFCASWATDSLSDRKGR